MTVAGERRPRVLFVGSSSYDLPLSPALERKWAAVAGEVDLRVVARAGAVDADDDRFRLVRTAPAGGGLGWYARLPRVVRREGESFLPDVVVAQSPYDGFAALGGLRALRPRPKLVIELHGDAGLAARHYGSRVRRVYAPVADRAAAFALRRADATRAVSAATARFARAATGREPEARFPAYLDLATFTEQPVRPLPDAPTAIWIGALQRTKDPEALAQAWRTVERELPSVRLVVVGDGPLRPVIEELAAELPGSVELRGRLAAADVAAALDGSTLLCMTSVSEGLPRVALESFARARPVVAFDVGGIGEIVEDDVNGVLLPERDPAALAAALIGVLGDRPRAAQLGAAGRTTVDRMGWTPERYAAALGDLVRRVAVSA